MSINVLSSVPNPCDAEHQPSRTDDNAGMLWLLYVSVRRRIEGCIRKDLRWAQPGVEVGWIPLEIVERPRPVLYLAPQTIGSVMRKAGVRGYRKIGPVRRMLEQRDKQKSQIAAEMQQIAAEERRTAAEKRCTAALMCHIAVEVRRIAVEVRRIAVEVRRIAVEVRRIVDHTEMVLRIVALEVLHIVVAYYCSFAVEAACSLGRSDIDCTSCQDNGKDKVKQRSAGEIPAAAAAAGGKKVGGRSDRSGAPTCQPRVPYIGERELRIVPSGCLRPDQLTLTRQSDRQNI